MVPRLTQCYKLYTAPLILSSLTFLFHHLFEFSSYFSDVILVSQTTDVQCMECLDLLQQRGQQSGVRKTWLSSHAQHLNMAIVIVKMHALTNSNLKGALAVGLVK